MSTDPAVAAARRAWYARYGTPAPTVYGLFDLATAAAREALAPIRARHYAITHMTDDNLDPVDLGGEHCAHCRDEYGEPAEWPCADALDAYSPEELT